MALLTTMNSTMPANCLPIMVSCKDGWLPKSFGKENKRGVAWKIMTLNYLLGLVPLLLGFNVKTITNNIMLLNSCMYLMCYYAYFQMPKKYPDAGSGPGGMWRTAYIIWYAPWAGRPVRHTGKLRFCPDPDHSHCEHCCHCYMLRPGPAARQKPGSHGEYHNLGRLEGA